MSEIYTNHPVKIDGTNYQIPFKKVEQLFSFDSTIPVVAVSTSGKGKTTYALDVLYKFSSQVRYVYFLTQTKSSTLTKGNAMSNVPKYFIKDLSKANAYDVLSKVWLDICERSESMHDSPDDITSVLAYLFPGKPIEDSIQKYIKNNFSHLSLLEQNIMQTEIRTRLIIDKANSNPELVEKLQTGNEHLHNVIHSMISGSCKTILILDDVSASLNNAGGDRGKITLPDGSRMTKSQSMVSLLKDIFTRARHMNCLVFMFVHDFQVFDTETLKGMKRFIFFDSAALNQFYTKGSFSQSARNFLRSVVSPDKIDIFNSTRYSYYGIYCDISDYATTTAVTKADLHQNVDIPRHPDVIKFHDILERVQVNQEHPGINNFALDFGQSAQFQPKFDDEKEESSGGLDLDEISEII